jgi:hypothetical protein
MLTTLRPLQILFWKGLRTIELNPENQVHNNMTLDIAISEMTSATQATPRRPSRSKSNRDVDIFFSHHDLKEDNILLGILIYEEDTLSIDLGQNPPTEFELQKDAFEAIPPIILAQYQGQFVVSRDGRILDSGNDLPELTKRFFDKHGKVHVYITRIPPAIPEQVLTPFFE